MLCRMDLVKCKICGEKHRLGGCPSLQDTRRASGTARKAPGGSESTGPSRYSPAVRTAGVKPRVMAAQETGRGEAEHSSRPANSPAFRKPLAKDAHKTLMAIKPWESEGVSRRTWYRRRKADERSKSK